MFRALVVILEIQKYDMEMIQLWRLKNQRQAELQNIYNIQADLEKQVLIQNSQITEMKMLIRLMEGDLAEVQAKIKKLEAQQNSVKKLDEFNALTHESAQADKERIQKEAKLSELMEKLAAEEEALKTLNQTLDTTKESSKALEEEIVESIKRINEEGHVLKQKRDELVKDADPEVFKIYERLLRNKRDQVVVPIENRACSGCHIMLTAQDENLVRKGERLVFCEHCSRIHYWQDSQAIEGTTAQTKQRRRRTTKV
jgi:predicted  nucleic acid-binding Zn-ribbon protein